MDNTDHDYLHEQVHQINRRLKALDDFDVHLGVFPSPEGNPVGYHWLRLANEQGDTITDDDYENIIDRLDQIMRENGAQYFMED